jgi:hypothetical protein
VEFYCDVNINSDGHVLLEINPKRKRGFGGTAPDKFIGMMYPCGPCQRHVKELVVNTVSTGGFGKQAAWKGDDMSLSNMKCMSHVTYC